MNKRKKNPKLEKKLDELKKRLLDYKFDEKTVGLRDEIVLEYGNMMLGAIMPLSSFEVAFAYEAAIHVMNSLEKKVRGDSAIIKEMAQNVQVTTESIVVPKDRRRIKRRTEKGN